MRNYRIKFGDGIISEEQKNLVNKVLNNNWLSDGPLCRELEKKLAEKFCYKHAIYTNSGTTADFLVLMSIRNPGTQQNIIVPSLCFAAVWNTAIAAGFEIRPIDIKRETLCIDETKIEEKIDENTVAIMAVTTMGSSPDLIYIRKLCNKYKIKLLIDNCEGLGINYKQYPMCNYADIETTSHFAAHILSSCGAEGGTIFTNNNELYEKLLSIKHHGRPPYSTLFNHINMGWNGKGMDLIAALLIPKVDEFYNIFTKRRNNINYISTGLKSQQDNFYTILDTEDLYISPHAFSICFKEDNEARFLRFYDYMENNGIQCKFNFKSITQQRGFDFLGYKYTEFPESEFVGRNSLHFGIHEYLEKNDLDFIIHTIQNFS